MASILQLTERGKTTTLRALGRYLQSDYYVISLDFQTFGAAKFKNENALAVSFGSSFLRFMKRNGVIMAGDFLEAVDHLSEKNTLFESIIGKVINYPELDRMLKEHIFNGHSVTFTVSDPVIDLAAMFGIIKNVNGFVVPANKIFDTILSNYYLSRSKMRDLDIYKEEYRISGYI